jgi:DNA-binding NarL/FixJ family response regulator
MNTTTNIKSEVVRYYLKGLTAKEIGKLLDLSPRTVQRYQRDERCKEMEQPKNREMKAIEMHSNGWSYAEIARKMRVSKTTVYLWHKKNNAKKEINE